MQIFTHTIVFRRIVIGTIVGFLMLSGVSDVGLCGSDPFKQARNEWDDSFEDPQLKWDRMKTSMDDEWDTTERASQREWDRFVRAVKRQWQEVRFSTQTEWVDYSEDLSARSYVDFKNGFLKIEALVKVKQAASLDHGAELIDRQFDNLFHQKNRMTGESHLSKQLTRVNGEDVTEQNLQQFIKKDVLPRIRVDEPRR